MILEMPRCSSAKIWTRFGEGITFVTEKGQKKPELRQLHEELGTCGRRLIQQDSIFGAGIEPHIAGANIKELEKKQGCRYNEN